MTLDLAFDDDQQALASAVASFCQRHCTDELVRSAAGVFPKDLWEGLAELGVLSLATPEGGGGALEVAAALEQLGRANCPGPLAATFLAGQLLAPEERIAVANGAFVVAAGVPPLMPWAPVADVFIEVAGDVLWRVRPMGPVQPVETLGGEPWGLVECERESEFESAGRALALADVALAAYLAGAGHRLVELAASYASDREQFGRPLADFQAVAHPLADCAVRVAAATQLARTAAFRFDAGDVRARASAAIARLSAAGAALAATYRAHQVFGALGFTVEGPVGLLGQRVRQVSLLAPGPRAAGEAVLEIYEL